MKTYKKTIEKPKLVIERDDFCESPREWSNLGYFVTVDNRLSSPDNYEYIERIIKETGQQATSQKEHIEMITKTINEKLDDKVIKIYPISKYEHSGVMYKLGNFFGFDYSNNGFYIITEKTQKELGTKPKDFEKVIQNELDAYNKWGNGEVYQFTLYDDNGEVEDSCGGFYDIEDIRDYLPKGWENEDLDAYLV